MSIKDVIKSSVYEQLAGGTGLGTGKLVCIFLMSIVIGLYIYAIYKNQAKSAFYSKDINITIAGLPVVICAIMIAMQSNLIVSLGMVGALSIVRFRNAVKNPLDLLYFFWSISAGIICGVGLMVLALVLCVAMTGIILFLQVFGGGGKTTTVIVLRTTEEGIDWIAVLETLKHFGKNVKQKSRSYQSGQTEVIYELVVSDEESLIKELKSYKKLNSINMLSHDGEYRI